MTAYVLKICCLSDAHSYYVRSLHKMLTLMNKLLGYVMNYITDVLKFRKSLKSSNHLRIRDVDVFMSFLKILILL
jgi:hypothetical protein